MNSIETYTRRFRTACDPLAAFRALGGGSEGTLLFETADESESSTRSFFITKPAFSLEIAGDLARLIRLDEVADLAVESLVAALSALEIVASSERAGRAHLFRLRKLEPATDDETRLKSASSADLLRTFATHFAPSRADVELRTAGAFAFDYVDHFEDLGPVRGEGVDARFVLPTELLEIDHSTDTVVAHRFDFCGRGAFEEGRRLAQLEQIICSLGPGRNAPSPVEPDTVAVSVDDQTFGGKVEHARRAITDGEAFQIVISRSFQTRCDDSMLAYEALRASNPSPYMFYLGGEETLFGASPETSVRVRNGLVEIRPLAGTRRRGTVDGQLDTDLDGRIETELRLDEKEVAEHMMLVDLARNDVARVCKPGTRRVSRLLGVDKYSAVMHLVSHVEGELREDLDSLHAYVAAMNMGTLTGAPKVRAGQILRELEGDRRGYYGGAVGYLTHTGEFDTAIVIRSATVRDGVATVRAGAGVVYDSDPAMEADETRRKAAAVLRAIGGAQEALHG